MISAERLRGIIRRMPYYFRHPMYVVHRSMVLLAGDNRGAVWSEGERAVIRSFRLAELGGDFCRLAHIERYIWAGSLVCGRECLDDGCGTGYGSHYLVKRARAKCVVGIDISKEAIGFARSHYRHPRLKFDQMDCLELAFPDETFDVVVSFDVLEHVSKKDQDRFLGETRRVLRKGGTLLIGCPNSPAATDDNPFHLGLLGASEFSHLLQRHYADVQFFGQDIVKNGVRAGLDYLREVEEVGLADLIIASTKVDSCFGLLAICTKPRE
jgi:2-polyprenyl-3-methyl-5-hydroxy-6-metoxy-1,4-benzoquinol methylase